VFRQNERLEQMIDSLRFLEIRPGTRLYADGGNGLILRFCTGLPIQTVMPVRKSFLDTYPGEVMIIESPRHEWLEPSEVGGILRRMGRPVPQATAPVQVVRDVFEHSIRKDLSARVKEVLPPPKATQDYFDLMIPYQHRKTAQVVAVEIEDSGSPMFKGYQTPDHSSLWQIFFFRFVNPESRLGPNLNYANRARQGRAYILPGGWVLIHCPALFEQPSPRSN
jgi:hypothetical protein